MNAADSAGSRRNIDIAEQPEHLAKRFKDAMLSQVLATPVMILTMENVALNAIRPFLDGGESAVGTAKHFARTLVGHAMRATALAQSLYWAPTWMA